MVSTTLPLIFIPAMSNDVGQKERDVDIVKCMLFSKADVIAGYISLNESESHAKNGTCT